MKQTKLLHDSKYSPQHLLDFVLIAIIYFHGSYNIPNTILSCVSAVIKISMKIK